MRVLILGGTADARALADRLVADGVDVVTSLAGRTTGPRMPAGDVRVGGFGGTSGLTGWLSAQGIDAVIDATHPFAATITGHAADACALLGISLLRLVRPGWAGHPDAPTWHWVADHAEAARSAARLGDRIVLTVGRQPLPSYLALAGCDVLARVAEATGDDLPPRWTVIAERGPFALTDEISLLRDFGAQVLVTKDSGGPTAAKLDAARVVGARVVVVSRPPAPAGVESVGDVDAAVAWLRHRQS